MPLVVTLAQSKLIVGISRRDILASARTVMSIGMYWKFDVLSKVNNSEKSSIF